MFMLDGDWLLLPLALAVLLWGARQADSEQVARLMSGEGDADALSMLFEPRRSHSLLPLDHFTCRDLMFYRAGWPVYRFCVPAAAGLNLSASASKWARSPSSIFWCSLAWCIANAKMWRWTKRPRGN